MICIQKLMAKRFLLAIAATATLLVVHCNQRSLSRKLREAFETAAPGDVIEIQQELLPSSAR